MNNSASSVQGLDLGCFAKAIGLVTFLNTLFILVYNAIGLYISSMGTIIVFRLTTKVYDLAIKL